MLTQYTHTYQIKMLTELDILTRNKQKLSVVLNNDKKNNLRV